MHVDSAAKQSAPTASQERYRALLVVFIAAATTWTVQEAWLTWRAGPHASCPERGQEQLLPELKQARLPPVSDAWEQPGCTPPAINESSLDHHRCRILTDLCIDQGRFISWAPEWRPGSRGFPPGQWRFDNAPTGLPGYPDMLQWEGGFQVHYCQPQPRFRAAALAPGAEQPDIESPQWSNCTVPIIFWPYWWMNLGEFIMETLNPIAEMYAGSHPLIRGRDATLVPVADGFTPPAFYDWLLWPFSAHKVEELSEFSARHHAGAESRSRCFQRVMFCALHNGQSPREGEDNAEGRQRQRPVAVAQSIVQFYADRFPHAFWGKSDPKTLQVLIIHRPHSQRRMLNLPQLLEACNAWVPPLTSSARRTRCRLVEFSDDGTVENLAAVRRADVLMGLHGAPLIYGLFMRPRSAVIELRPHQFEGKWPNLYSQTTYNIEKTIRFFYLPTNELNWRPSRDEVRGLGHPRDRHVIVDWDKLQRVLADVVNGEPGYEPVLLGKEAPHYEETEER